jgi:hypothetical protein
MTQGGGPATVEGNLASVDLEKRFFTLENQDGVIFVRVEYGPAFDQKIQKQKVGYYEKPVVEMTGTDTARLVDLPFVQRPQGYPRLKGQQQQKGGRPFHPRNEKLIVYQCTYKEACETVRALILQPDSVMDETEFNRVMDIALARALKDGAEIIRAGGA